MKCSSESQTSSTVAFNDLPRSHDLVFVRGDQVDRKFLFTGVCYTDERPTDVDGLSMYANGETVEAGDTASPIVLVAPWEERYWHAEIRNGYVSTMRYYNGWVPWYGSAPKNWTWWMLTSLKAMFLCDSEYSDEYQGTIVSISLPSAKSATIMPSSSYNWDLESARPVEFDEVEQPVRFDNLKTWLSGGVTVSGDWTLMTPLGHYAS